MHQVNAKSILSSKNGMNLYRGCTHGCIYCDSRSACYNMEHDFEDVEVKINGPQLLEKALRSKKKRGMIVTGAMCDPYLPLEKELGLTRKCLELIERYDYGVSLLTKSDLILRDLDLLKKIHEKTKCVVQMTLTTADEELCQILEPNVCTTKRRAEVLNIMRQEGIPTIIWMTPILPFINDTQENIDSILNYARQAKSYGVLAFKIGMTLRLGDREYYYKKLDEHFPGLRKRYVQTYANAYDVPSPANKTLMKYFKSRCKEYGLECQVNKLFAYMGQFEEKNAPVQMKLEF